MAESHLTEHGLDTAAIRAAAKNLDDGPVTEGYKGDREGVIALLNGALATELVCVLRYKRHYYTVIVQLNGKPDFNPATLPARSHAEYDDSDDVKAMIRANLIAERVAIESYRQMIEQIGDTDPTTRHLLIKIMAVEEEHADDMRDLLE